MDKKEDNGKERKAAETERKEKLIIEGNAFYEIDLECIKEKQKKTTAGQKTGRKIEKQKLKVRKREENKSRKWRR